MWELNLEIEVLFQEGFGELKNSFGVAKVKLAIWFQTKDSKVLVMEEELIWKKKWKKKALIRGIESIEYEKREREKGSSKKKKIRRKRGIPYILAKSASWDASWEKLISSMSGEGIHSLLVGYQRQIYSAIVEL